MSERKVLNKYYPPDFDPNNIPRSKVVRNGTFGVRLMAPCNMKCNTCGEYIAKGKKFNSRKEDVNDERFLGLRIYRFYIKCPMCMAEIVFKTDPEHTDYILEAGATRNFQAQILAQRQAQADADREEEELNNNPMKMLENRTKQSRHEMDMIEKLEELRELNHRQSHINYDQILKQYAVTEQRRQEQIQEEEDEQLVRSVFGGSAGCVKRLHDSGSDSESPVTATVTTLTHTLTSSTVDQKPVAKASEKKPWERSLGSFTSKSDAKKSSNILGIVKTRKQQKCSHPSDQLKSSAISCKPADPTLPAHSSTRTSVVQSSQPKTFDTSSTCQPFRIQLQASTADKVQTEAPPSEKSANSCQSLVDRGGVSSVRSQQQSGLSLLGAYSDSDSESS